MVGSSGSSSPPASKGTGSRCCVAQEHMAEATELQQKQPCALGAHQVCSSRAFRRCPEVWEPVNDFVERSYSVLADRWESQKRAVVTLNVAPSGLESRPREFLATSKLSVCVTGLDRYYLKLSIIIVIGTIYVLSL